MEGWRWGVEGEGWGQAGAPSEAETGGQLHTGGGDSEPASLQRVSPLIWSSVSSGCWGGRGLHESLPLHHFQDTELTLAGKKCAKKHTQPRNNSELRVKSESDVDVWRVRRGRLALLTSAGGQSDAAPRAARCLPSDGAAVSANEGVGCEKQGKINNKERRRAVRHTCSAERICR